jgi:methionyl-tRNA formyltransferase
MSSLRLAFMGTPTFAVPSLEALLAAGHEVACVYTQPPRPAGRGYALRPSPVHGAAEAHGLLVRTPRTLRTPDAAAALAALGLDAAVVVAYGLILPPPVLAAPRLGSINVHASLLPRWRGAAPIQRAILSGDRETGISIMAMDEGLDTGPVLLQAVVPITDRTTAEALHDRLAALGASLLVAALDGLAAGTLHPVPQPAEGVTYAAKLGREDGRINWAAGASAIARQVRALAPWPGAWFDGPRDKAAERIKVLDVEAADPPGPGVPPGTVLDERFTIACGAGSALRLAQVQRPGKAPVEGAAFLRGLALPVGAVLPAAA